MKKLLSLPPCLVGCFHEVEGVGSDEWFCTNDPVGARLGSGGGTAWLLRSCHEADEPDTDFNTWLAKEKRILLHAGGQSRRLPAYATGGKVLTPIPIFRWAKGQRISQNLLQLQLPVYESIMETAPARLHTLVASGDVYIRASRLPEIPDADVVCYGLWADPTLASHHGVFVSNANTPGKLDFMLQKPSIGIIRSLLPDHLLLMDVGVWLLSDRAVELLMKKSTHGEDRVINYDLYGTFGCSLGCHPTIEDEELARLTVAIIPLPEGEFYHYGTSRELISSTVAIQNLVSDQRAIYHYGVKPHPSIFVQNAHTEVSLTPDNQNIWIENAHVGKGWTLSQGNIITGVPPNEWNITLPPNACVDVVPWDNGGYVLRPYGFDDTFRGSLADSSTLYMGMPVAEWLSTHDIKVEEVAGNADLQTSALFPVLHDVGEMGQVLQWMLTGGGREATYHAAVKVSASEVSDHANVARLCRQRVEFRRENLSALAENHRMSVFYQTNLAHMAREFVRLGVPTPKKLGEGEPLLKRISDQMFRSQLARLRGKDGSQEESEAFALLRKGLTADVLTRKQHPHQDVHTDQIVWSRSPVRIDLAGGWTDTPPYCLTNGGNVVNLAIELNGQPPLQAYVKCCREPKIILRSIDLGAAEAVTTYEELENFANVGSPFSIPKAALAMAGFSPSFSLVRYKSLEEQLQDFGCGMEVTLLSAVPAGSGLGTSSILAATVLGAVSDFCGLHWSKTEVCNRTLVLEQLLTTGGGWQDQYGGVLHGLKLLRTNPGFDQTPVTNWLPDTLYTDPQYATCHLLYYTGITRTAKTILAEIVRNMFLYDTQSLALLSNMKQHALDMHTAIQHNDFAALGRLTGKSWQQNKALDAGTNPPEVEVIIRQISDLCLGYKLPGAGGGGFLYMIAKDPTAACRIRNTLSAHPHNPRARFVNMNLSMTGMQISRS